MAACATMVRMCGFIVTHPLSLDKVDLSRIYPLIPKYTVMMLREYGETGTR
jgi:hypothetical protein